MNINMDTKTALLIGAGAVGVFLLYKGAKSAAAALDPTSTENVIYQSVGGETGAVQTAADYFFGAIDIINPWADEYRKSYAWQIWSGGE